VSERRRASFTFKYEIRNEKRELVATATRAMRAGTRLPEDDRAAEWLKEIMSDDDLDPPTLRS
jgi:acyl-CoA thioesterase FadM